ncbi:MAG: tetratricopeptide repeat protein [Pirellulales bacterium]
MSSSADSADAAPPQWSGLKAVIVGKLAAGTPSQARKALAVQGAELVNELAGEVRLVIVGEQDLPPADLLEQIAALGTPPDEVRVVSETQFRQLAGLDDTSHDLHRLYTPAMLGDLLGVPTAAVRAWHRRKLIHAVREVRKLPYFDFREVQTARRLAELLANGATATEIARQLTALRRLLPSVEHPLEQLSVIVDGGELMLRQASGLVEAGGQYRIDFFNDGSQPDDDIHSSAAATTPLPELTDGIAPPRTVKSLIAAAERCEEEGRLSEAAEAYRAALATSGPTAELCFALADVLYRMGDVAAARERYFMAVELNEDYVEARANLGCLLAEEGRYDLAIASLQGALAYHHDYSDAHYQLARVLDDVGRGDEARRHWQAFLDLSPASPWAADARRRLGMKPAATAEDDA